MSGIGAVGGSTSQIGLYAGPSNVGSAGTSSGGPAGSGLVVALLFNPNPQASPSGSTSPDAPPAATAGSTGLTDLRQQIDAAIAAALQTYEAGSGSNSSGGSTALTPTGSASTATGSGTPDILQAISDAITQTLQKNGIDPRQLQQQFAAGGHHHHHHHAESSSATDSQASSAPGSPADSTSSSQANGPDSANQQSLGQQGLNQQGLKLLEQVLQSADPGSAGGQLGTSLFALGDPSSQSPGLSDLAQLLSSLPAGSNVNAVG